MTAQEIFDTVLAHLRAQGVASVGDGPIGCLTCMYRTPSGLMCAVGCLIPDEIYTPDMEGEDAYYVVRRYLIPAGLIGDESDPLLADLQWAHDTRMPREPAQSLADWEQHMSAIASRHGLIYTPPSKGSAMPSDCTNGAQAVKTREVAA